MTFDSDGAEHVPGAIVRIQLEALLAMISTAPTAPGLRLVDRPDIVVWLAQSGVDQEAASRVGVGAKPVRAILFDKGDGANWALGWHQDRTIAVRARGEVDGFGPWSIKAGICHVEPPFSLIQRMATVRIHLDPVPEDNAPLLIVPGSHTLGRLTDSDVEAIGNAGPVVACLAQAGDAWWYRTSIVHASARATAGGRRRVLQVDYSADQLPATIAWRGVA